MSTSHDFDLYVIGAGSGGVRAARFAAGLGARVAVAENRYLGGTCVNVGCVPKKLLVYSSHFSEDFERAPGFGWTVGATTFDWATLLRNKDEEIARLNGVYERLLSGSGVSIHRGQARIVDPHTVEVDGRRHRARHILVATGGWPVKPDIPGADLAIDSNEAFHLPSLPGSVLVIGGGYIAVEFAGIFHGLGAKTTLAYRGGLFLRGFDQAVREHLRDEMQGQGVDLRFDWVPTAIRRRDDGRLVVSAKSGDEIVVDTVMFATGRRPMLDGLGLEQTAVRLDHHGQVIVNERYQTDEPSIHAIGDVVGRLPLTPVALAEGMALARALFQPASFKPVDYHLIPTAVFSQPTIGTVGLSEQEAREAGHRLKIFTSRFKPMSLAMTGLQHQVFMKLVVDAASDRVLGCHMVGPEAGEIIQGLAVALKAGATKQIFDETIGIHPTSAEEFVTMRTPTSVDD